jgi:hypothetical protein
LKYLLYNILEFHKISSGHRNNCFPQLQPSEEHYLHHHDRCHQGDTAAHTSWWNLTIQANQLSMLLLAVPPIIIAQNENFDG